MIELYHNLLTVNVHFLLVGVPLGAPVLAPLVIGVVVLARTPPLLRMLVLLHTHARPRNSRLKINRIFLKKLPLSMHVEISLLQA